MRDADLDAYPARTSKHPCPGTPTSRDPSTYLSQARSSRQAPGATNRDATHSMPVRSPAARASSAVKCAFSLMPRSLAASSNATRTSWAACVGNYKAGAHLVTWWPTTIRAAGETCQASRSEATRKGIAWVVELTLRAGLQPQEPESHRSAIAPRRGVRGHDRDPQGLAR
jgi:hypothetical protein